MDEKSRIGFYVETLTASLERTIKRLWVLCLILIVLLFASNAVWIWYESQFEEIETTVVAEQETDGGGSNYAVGGDLIG